MLPGSAGYPGCLSLLYMLAGCAKYGDCLAGHADRLAILDVMAGLLCLIYWLFGYDNWLC